MVALYRRERGFFYCSQFKNHGSGVLILRKQAVKCLPLAISSLQPANMHISARIKTNHTTPKEVLALSGFCLVCKSKRQIFLASLPEAWYRAPFHRPRAVDVTSLKGQMSDNFYKLQEHLAGYPASKLIGLLNQKKLLTVNGLQLLMRVVSCAIPISDNRLKCTTKWRSLLQRVQVNLAAVLDANPAV